MVPPLFGLFLQPQRVAGALLQLRPAALVFFGVVLIYDGYLFLPVFQFFLQGHDKAFHDGGRERLHPRFHRLVAQADPRQRGAYLLGGTCKR